MDLERALGSLVPRYALLAPPPPHTRALLCPSFSGRPHVAPQSSSLSAQPLLCVCVRALNRVCVSIPIHQLHTSLCAPRATSCPHRAWHTHAPYAHHKRQLTARPPPCAHAPPACAPPALPILPSSRERRMPLPPFLRMLLLLHACMHPAAALTLIVQQETGNTRPPPPRLPLHASVCVRPALPLLPSS